jgi:hypothetical protein
VLRTGKSIIPVFRKALRGICVARARTGGKTRLPIVDRPKGGIWNRILLTAPVIYSVLIPILLLDIFVIAYEAICFPIYKIPRVRRRDFLMFDRHHLAYLNTIEKINCAYCSYANGAISFAREASARTEVYWCPIKHARRILGPHPYYRDFADFGDAEAYREQLDLKKTGVEIG